LIVAGSGTNLPLFRKIAELYQQEHPETKVVVPTSIGTGGAVRALMDSAIDLGLASRKLKEREKRAGIVEIPFATVELVIAANSSVKEKTVTEIDLLDIYNGKRTHWSDGAPVVPLIRESGDSSRAVFAKILPALEASMVRAFHSRAWKVCYTDGQMVQALVSIPGSIGFMDLGTVLIEGLPMKTYPFPGVDAKKPLSMLTMGRPEGEVEDFIEFARSSAVQDILRLGGYLPPDV
jgi:phosphate transport system substrate-binding protein